MNSDATATVLGPATISIKKGGAQLLWTSKPVNAFTISGPVTFNFWMLESALAANAGAQAAIDIFTQSGTFLANVVASPKGTELPTTVAAQNWTATPGGGGYAVPQGAIIVVSLFFVDAGGTMAAGNTVTASYNGPTAAANGDSWVQFTETITLVSGAPPANTVLPSITGSPQVGSLLVGNSGTWSGSPALGYQWNAAGVAIGGAVNQTYTPVPGDVGKTLTLTVAGTNASGGPVYATSLPTAGVTPASTGNISPPVISGSLTVGSVLACTPGVWQDPQPSSFAYQWLSSPDGATPPGDAGWTPLLGETNPTYKILAAALFFDCAVIAS